MDNINSQLSKYYNILDEDDIKMINEDDCDTHETYDSDDEFEYTWGDE